VDFLSKENTLLQSDFSQTAQSPIIQTTAPPENQTVNCSPKSKQQSVLQQKRVTREPVAHPREPRVMVKATKTLQNDFLNMHLWSD
jgi:hypothetical protein